MDDGRKKSFLKLFKGNNKKTWSRHHHKKEKIRFRASLLYQRTILIIVRKALEMYIGVQSTENNFGEEEEIEGIVSVIWPDWNEEDSFRRLPALKIFDTRRSNKKKR